MSSDYFAGDPRSNYERMIAGDGYISDDPQITAAQAEAAQRTAAFNQAYQTDPDGSQTLAADVFGSFGAETHVRAPVQADYGFHISLGERVFINWGLIAVDVARIRIGDDCQIGPGVQLLTATHPVEPTARRDKVEGSAPITLEQNVWLGGGVTICPGVTIGKNSVIGAGAVVTKDIPAQVVAVGNPAQVIRQNI